MGGKYHLKENHLLSWMLSNSHKIGVEVIKSIQIDSPMPDIHIDFIDNNSVNAYAFKEGDLYFIGINKGTIMALYSFFNINVCCLHTNSLVHR